MADTIAINLSGNKISETYKGVLHFDSKLQQNERKPVYDGVGTKTALTLGNVTDGVIIDGDLQVLNDLVISSDSNLIGNVNIGGNVILNNGGTVNDLVINSINEPVSLRAIKRAEVGNLRIRESDTDYELIFGNPTQVTPNLFSIIVKKDNTNNLYIKNNYGDPDANAPLWINRATGEVNIQSLNVSKFNNTGTGAGTSVGNTNNTGGGGLFPTGGVMMFALSGIPNGWLECNGSILSINNYKDLYNVIGQHYTVLQSVNRTINFQIPDMRGLFVRGWDNQKLIDSGRGLGSTQDDLIKAHDHPFYWGQNAGTPAIGGATPGNDVQNYNFYGIGGDQIGNTGGNETRPKNIALIYCIKT